MTNITECDISNLMRNARVICNVTGSYITSFPKGVEYHLLNNPHTYPQSDIFISKKDLSREYCIKTNINYIDILICNEMKYIELLDMVDIVVSSIERKIDELPYTYRLETNCIKNNILDTEIKYISMRVSMAEYIQKTQVYIACISLERYTNRREHSINQLNKLGLPYEIFNAVDGKYVDVDGSRNIISYNNETFKYNPKMRNNRNIMSYGEIGCFLSHILLIRKMLKTNFNYFLILEDDNTILDYHEARLQLSHIPTHINFEMCLLSASMNRPFLMKTPINKYFSFPTNTLFNRANAILFTRVGLENILSSFDKTGVSIPYDDYLEENIANIIIPNKFLYKLDDEKFDSAIWHIYDDEDFTKMAHNKIQTGKIFANLNGWARMGNCLFQYAFIKAQSVNKGMHIYLKDTCKELYELFPHVTYQIGTPSNLMELNEQDFHFNSQLINDINPIYNYNIQGYFQSYKYFMNNIDIIKNSFKIRDSYIRRALKLYVSLTNDKKLCGIHIRLPDQTGDQGFLYTTPSNSFLSKAIEIMGLNMRYVVCSNDIEECEKLYKELLPIDTYFSRGNKYDDFTLLTVCDHNIITSGSYGWWSAFLNNSKNKKIVCITPNFNDKVCIKNESDYYPSDWIKIPN